MLNARKKNFLLMWHQPWTLKAKKKKKKLNIPKDNAIKS